MGGPSGPPGLFCCEVAMTKTEFIYLLVGCLLALALAFVPVGNHLSIEKNEDGNWRVYAVPGKVNAK